ncbi:hypothetical protein WN51_01493 [Melipona quadrifasciata]|uniref:Uncharacterized protein n=1 Tax=Melipona quadrifasciata TaxID=166423 RepID=A0A0N0U4F6_9HYME|nr:hypothetical protein WN51_01493 [Melipona quadrifasciata]
MAGESNKFQFNSFSVSCRKYKSQGFLDFKGRGRGKLGTIVSASEFVKKDEREEDAGKKVKKRKKKKEKANVPAGSVRGFLHPSCPSFGCFHGRHLVGSFTPGRRAARGEQRGQGREKSAAGRRGRGRGRGGGGGGGGGGGRGGSGSGGGGGGRRRDVAGTWARRAAARGTGKWKERETERDGAEEGAEEETHGERESCPWMEAAWKPEVSFLGRQLWLRFEQEVEIGVRGKTGGDVPIRAVRLLSWILMEHHEARNTAVLN